MAKVNQLVHESVHQNPLSHLISTHYLRSTQGLDLTNFDTVLSILKSTYDKIMLYEIGKWFIIKIFHNLSDMRKIIHGGEKRYFPRKVQQHFLRKWFDEKFEHGSVVWKHEKFTALQFFFVKSIHSKVH